MKVTAAQVQVVAQMARLSVPADRLDAVAAELSAVLDAFDVLATIPLNEASADADAQLARRPDEVVGELGPDQVKLNSQHVNDSSFVVPKVLE
jgi:aspartyl-tRNA(Asn)/glutamyl-tRNA(Gln) amidotransferase subunit C